MANHIGLEAFRDLQLDVITEDMFRALKQAQDNPYHSLPFHCSFSP